VHNGILLSVANQRILLLAVLEPLSIVLDTAGKAIESSGSNLPVLTDHDAPDLG
ncbi:uncharacterized protein METZ01_LOCUS184973, partial [marine metagenome]